MTTNSAMNYLVLFGENEEKKFESIIEAASFCMNVCEENEEDEPELYYLASDTKKSYLWSGKAAEKSALIEKVAIEIADLYGLDTENTCANGNFPSFFEYVITGFKNWDQVVEIADETNLDIIWIRKKQGWSNPERWVTYEIGPDEAWERVKGEEEYNDEITFTEDGYHYQPALSISL